MFEQNAAVSTSIICYRVARRKASESSHVTTDTSGYLFRFRGCEAMEPAR